MKAKPYPKKVLLRFGKNVATLRRGTGLTQEALAEKLDINVRHLQKIEAGEVAPSFGSLYCFRRTFKVQWSDLFLDCD